MYVLCISAGVWGVVQYNTKRLKTENQKLEKTIAERTQEIAQSYKNVQLLNEIAKQLSASLDVKTIIATVYTNVNTLMSAEMFGIGIYNPKTQVLEFEGFMENDIELEFHTEQIENSNFNGRCFISQQDIIIHDFRKENSNYQIQVGSIPQSIIMLPLTYNENKIGVITIQSLKANIYTEYHLRMLRSIAINTTSVLENALSFRKIELQRHELFEKNADIIASINYAKRIQTAMLPTQETLDKYLGKDNYFVLFKPRDIVSGDFYWIRVVNNKIIVVVADCTGHGVPGAFVSMVGNSTLNEITKRGLSHTHLILSKLHKEISTFFNQNTNVISTECLPTTDNLKVQDGMDISIIVIDKETKSIEYSGAKNALYYVMNGEMKEIKADKYSIGGHQEENEAERVFVKHIVSLSPPVEMSHHPEGGVFDVIVPPSGVRGLSAGLFYLFTDGFQDQFGGKDNRKFMRTRFKELLLSISGLPMAEQQQILSSTINEWIGEREQTDDITVMGMRI